MEEQTRYVFLYCKNIIESTFFGGHDIAYYLRVRLGVYCLHCGKRIVTSLYENTTLLEVK